MIPRRVSKDPGGKHGYITGEPSGFGIDTAIGVVSSPLNAASNSLPDSVNNVIGGAFDKLRHGVNYENRGVRPDMTPEEKETARRLSPGSRMIPGTQDAGLRRRSEARAAGRVFAP